MVSADVEPFFCSGLPLLALKWLKVKFFMLLFMYFCIYFNSLQFLFNRKHQFFGAKGE